MANTKIRKAQAGIPPAGTTNQVLKKNSNTDFDVDWSSDADTGITQLTGDVTAGPGSGSQAATLATVNSNVGTFGTGTQVGTFTVNAKGLITAASNTAISAITVATGTTGTDFNVSGSPVSPGGTVTLNIPDASTTNRGLVTTGTQIFGGFKTVRQATLGNEVFRLESVATNDDPSERVFQNRVATTDATTTTIHTFAIPTDTVVRIRSLVIARRTNGTGEGASYERSATYKNVAGVVSIIGSINSIVDEDIALWNSTLTISGTNVLDEVAGRAGDNVTWHLTARTYQLSS